MNEVHAGGVIGGRIDRKAPDTPSFINFAKLGIPPSAIHGRISVHVAASNPMIITFGSFFMSGADSYRLYRTYVRSKCGPPAVLESNHLYTRHVCIPVASNRKSMTRASIAVSRSLTIWRLLNGQ